MPLERILNIRYNYGMSEEERAAAYAEALAAKIAELKNKYANVAGYGDYDDDDWTRLAEMYLGSSVAHAINSFYIGHAGVEHNPELAMWLQYTYEEILQMEAGGVLIPEEILEWAHSMQDADVTSYDIDETETPEETTNTRGGNEYFELEKETKKLSKKSKKANDNTNVKYEEFQIISKKADDVKKEQEATQNDALKEIQELNEEYAQIAKKLENGKQLSDFEIKRYQELNSLLNGEDGKLMADLQVTVGELEDLMNSMESLDKEIDSNIELGNDTVEIATELALYEKEHDYTNIEPNFFINVATNDVIENIFGAQGQSIARDAFDNGSNLVKFSNTLDNTLMSTQYTALYEFATEFSINAEAVIDETREVMGDNFNQTTDELNATEKENQEEKQQNLTIQELIAKRLETRELIQKDIEVRGASLKVAENVAKEVEAFKEEQAELANEKQDAVENVEETQEVEQEEIEKSKEVGEIENSEETHETQSEQNSETQEAEQKVLSIDEAIAQSELKGDTAKARLEKAVEVNGIYDQFNSETAEILNATTGIGAISSVFGTSMMAHGQLLIAEGMALILNPVLATILIYKGTLELTAGLGYFGVGSNLIATAFKGIDETAITGEQIDLTDEIIEKAMEKIEAMENGEEVSEGDVISQAQKDLMQMIADGKSLPEQAIAFTLKSNQASSDAKEGLIKTALTGMVSTVIAKDAEMSANRIEKRFKDDKEEYDELIEKKEQAQETKESLEDDSTASGAVDTNEIGEEVFSERDQQRLNKLTDKLQKKGDRVQIRLQKQLETVEGLSEFLAEQDEVAFNAIDYGQVAQLVGMNLFDQSKNNVLLIHRMLLSMMAIRSGKIAQFAGEKLDEAVDTTTTKNNLNVSKIHDAQQKVFEVTMSKALYAQENEETEETVDSQEVEVEDEAPQGAAAMVQGRGISRLMNLKNQFNQDSGGIGSTDNSDNSNGTNDSNNGEDDGEEQNIVKLISAHGSNEGQAKSAVNTCKSATSQAKIDSKESQRNTKDAQKDEKQLTTEGKNLLKLIDQDKKEVEKLTEESLQAVAEQERLVAEFEKLNAENETLNQSLQNQAPQPTSQTSNGNQEENLPSIQDTSSQQNIVTIYANQSRMGEISTRFNTLDTTINTNRYKMTRIQGNINKRVRKYQKVTDTRIKLQEKARKSEEAKIKRMEKTNAALDIASNTFSIINGIGTLMQVLGTTFETAGEFLFETGKALCSTGYGAIAGAIMITTGLIMMGLGKASSIGGLGLAGWCAVGVAACQIAKAGVLAANGYTKEAITTLGNAIISIAGSFMGTSSAASGVMQGISAGSSIVGSSAQLAANVQTVQGKEQSEWLGTVSQAAGMVGGLSSSGAGLADGFENGFDAATKLIGATGQIVSSTSQISTWIKQGKGKETGEFEEIMGQIGMGLSTASSLMSLGQKAFDDDNATEENNAKKKITKDDNVNDDDNVNKKVDNNDDSKNDDQKVEEKEKSSDVENNEAKNDNNAPVITNENDEVVPTDKVVLNIEEKVKEVDNAKVNVDEDKVEAVQNYDGQQQSDEQEQQELSRKERRAQRQEEKNNARVEKQKSKELAKERKKEARIDARNEKKETISENKDTNANESELTKKQKTAQKEEVQASEQQQKDDEKNETKLSRKERKEQEENPANEEFTNKVAEANGLKEQPRQEIDGKTFELSKDGKLKIDGNEVSPSEMHSKMKQARANDNGEQVQLQDAKVGEGFFIDDIEFVKQQDNSFKVVLEYDENLNQKLSDAQYSARKIQKIIDKNEEQTAQWFTKQVNKQNRQDKIERISKIGNKIMDATSETYNTALKFANMLANEEQPEQQIVYIHDMKKARALAKKIKNRRNANLNNYRSYNPYRNV